MQVSGASVNPSSPLRKSKKKTSLKNRENFLKIAILGIELKMPKTKPPKNRKKQKSKLSKNRKLSEFACVLRPLAFLGTLTVSRLCYHLACKNWLSILKTQTVQNLTELSKTEAEGNETLTKNPRKQQRRGSPSSMGWCVRKVTTGQCNVPYVFHRKRTWMQLKQ